jgi:uncharacterized repeat protein (TIGR03803 family)
MLYTVPQLPPLPPDSVVPSSVPLTAMSVPYGLSPSLPPSNGAVFSITPSGKERLLYSFGSKSTDGKYPKSRLMAYNGTLYGTTTQGGSDNDGTVFEVSLSGKEQILHSFNGGDGADPTAGLLQVNGVLYGTTPEVYSEINGTVYALTP